MARKTIKRATKRVKLTKPPRRGALLQTDDTPGERIAAALTIDGLSDLNPSDRRALHRWLLKKAGEVLKAKPGEYAKRYRARLYLTV